MATYLSSPKSIPEDGSAATAASPVGPIEIDVGLITGGFDRPYAFGLATALTSKAVRLDVVGSDEVDSPEMHTNPRLKFLNLQGNPRERVGWLTKLAMVLVFYVRLVRYAATARPKIFHVLWNNKVQFFDRTLLMLYYKLLGKKVVFTAHNVNAGKRDGNDSALNRFSLKIQYKLADHIFVHTEKMKTELHQEFGIRNGAVTVIPFGINNSVPDTGLTPAEAKGQLGIGCKEKTVLFFGAIRPYKGLEYLVAAFQRVARHHEGYWLIIAGEPKKGAEQYVRDIQKSIESDSSRERVVQRIEFVPDSETELYFKAADASVLPYTLVFQSGVLFLSYSFGLPVIAADVGSFREDVIDGQTGFLYDPRDPEGLARAIEKYFASDLFKTLDRRRQEIREYASARHSWDIVGEMTRRVYLDLLGE